ncbi:unnamed protein product [Rhizoctonia solani]|uniref:Uncharacterized protein n=1 Tax=Rhizoctonia solani TaxID=456999 RepID=A0A8H3DGU4_9AGAM|nr:unnamed protein product [Rhizoctonia solani]
MFPRATSFRGGARGRGRGRGSGLGSPQPVLRTRFPPCCRHACKIQGYCELKVLEQEYGSLPQNNTRDWRVGRSHSDDSASRKEVLDDPRAFLKEFFGTYEVRHRQEQPRVMVYYYKYWRPVISEFYRMCWAFDWKKPENEEEPPNSDFVEARKKFSDALTQQFNALYGTAEDDLSSWQNLCCVLNLANIPEELEACRNLVTSVHVNIVDLVDTPVTHDPIVHFKNEEHLSIYTRHTRKKFPKDNLHSGDLLRFLLRKIDAYEPESRN